MTDAVLYVEEFFASAEVDALQRYLIDREADFVASEVINGDNGGCYDDDYRRSKVLYDVADVYPFFADRLMECFPYVVDRLGQPMFDVGQIELQLTVSGDRQWFKAHRDSGHDAVETRAVTFVYYCHREPRSFQGGELLIFGDDDNISDQEASHEQVRLSPSQNSIVFFPSNFLHEVLPISCTSGSFGDGRLTYNGWFHK